MPTRKTGPEAKTRVVEKVLKDTETILFDSVIELALRHFSMVEKKKFGFACQELLNKRRVLMAESSRRTPVYSKKNTSDGRIK